MLKIEVVERKQKMPSFISGQEMTGDDDDNDGKVYLLYLPNRPLINNNIITNFHQKQKQQ